jgi:hypothetical protein
MGYTSLLLKTGQTTSVITGDDGDLEKGVARSFTTLDTGQYAGTTNITMAGKTDIHSNECVQDNVTGLMWSLNQSASVGPDDAKGGVGFMPWTTDGDGNGIFVYVAAANAAGLSGYSDWRIPNMYEAETTWDFESYLGVFNASWFGFWSSTTHTILAKIQDGTEVVMTEYWYKVSLVRGDPTAPPTGVNTLRSLLGAGY